MKEFTPTTIAVAALVAFVTAVVAGTIVAMAMGPFINESFGQMIRDPGGDGLLFPSLLSGYAVIACGLAWLYPRVFRDPTRWTEAATLGGVVGLSVFLGGHLVVSGWSRMPLWSMATSGVLDSIAIVAAATTLRWVYERGRKERASVHE